MNFLEFIKGDTESKKTYISSLPTNNKTNIRKYNDTIDTYLSKYNEYKVSVKKYLDAKSASYKLEDEGLNIDEVSLRLEEMNHVCAILNPFNTYFEKMDFDRMIYKMDNFSEFGFNEVNEVIDKFLDKFALAGIALTKEDFEYTYYVKKYMSSFIENRNQKNNSFDNLNSIFEEVYWSNPEIISHIEVCFRKLIKKHEKAFNNYLTSLKKELMNKYNVSSYDDAVKKYHEVYKELNSAKEESIYGIIELAKNGSIDMSSYFPDSKHRVSVFENMMINPIDYNDKSELSKFYDTIYRLKLNLVEYSNYLYFLPLFNDFKKTYQKKLGDDNKEIDKNLRSILNEIKEKESKLDKLNKKIFHDKASLFELNNNLKKEKQESLNIANEIYALYQKYDLEYFDVKVLTNINKLSTIKDLLNIYYSFDYFKMISIKKVFDVENYSELLDNLKKLDSFALNPENVICNVINIFEEEKVDDMIINKYKLSNINITEDNLSSGEVPTLISNIEMLLRIREIESSKLDVEKIWFIAEVAKINNSNKG